MISKQNPDSMSVESVISEINDIHGGIRIQGKRVYDLAQSLYRRTRRTPADDTTSVYLTYANAMTRFAGALEQVSVRTMRVARVLKQLPELEEPKRELPKKVKESTPIEALITSYTDPSIEPEILNAE